MSIKGQPLVCKGSWALGTACGNCAACRLNAPDYIRALKEELKAQQANFDMYVNAWMREIDPPYYFNKFHRIDALVLTTRDIKRKADRFDREFGQDLPKHIYAELATSWFEGRGTL